jgi:hypothetical protein
MEPCSAGELKQNDCTNYTSLLDVQNLSDEKKNLFWQRLRKPGHLKTVCMPASPEKYCSGTYTHLFGGKWCSLYWRHKAAVRISLHNISLQFAHQVQHSSLTPGESFCLNCYIKMKQNSDESDDPACTELGKAILIHTSFSEVGVSPAKRRQLSNQQKTAFGKYNLQQVSSAVKDNL